MRRENKATVKDAGLGAAFVEGVNEGFRLDGYVLLSVTVGGKEITTNTIKAADVPTVVGELLDGMRGEHYAAGLIIRVFSADPAAATPTPPPTMEGAPLPDGVEDAEIVSE